MSVHFDLTVVILDRFVNLKHSTSLPKLLSEYIYIYLFMRNIGLSVNANQHLVLNYLNFQPCLFVFFCLFSLISVNSNLFYFDVYC